MRKKNNTQWDDVDVAVESVLVPRYLYTSASVNVYVAGNCILQTGGVMRFSGKNMAEFAHNGTDHQVVLDWTSGRSSVGYTLMIDGDKILEGSVFPRNALMGMTPVFIFAVAMLVIQYL
ncbi:MAG TPA: hypothetical protein VLT91_04560 [Rhizomicrobium sp.]|nr:hypothetical protein [Rhizomicrobium sp.]